MRTTDTQVVVVGAGPVGLMLAGELRLGGADVVVVERLSAPMTESRASTLHARTMEILDERGLHQALGDPPQDRMGHFGGVPLDLGAVPTRFPGQWKVPQTEVEALLADWACGLGADLRRGHELHDLTTTADGVRVRLAGPDGPVTLTCRYLVGCDGETSTVRQLAGIGFPGTDATRTMLRADVAGIRVPDRRFERLPDGLAVAARRPDGVTRVMVCEFAPPAPPPEGEPSFAHVCQAWWRVTGEDIHDGTPLWLNAFGNAARQAHRYRVGPVLLAGDAAHQQLPAGGQAINLGIQDAVNLGWKLAAEVAGHAPAGLLDTYHDERHAVAARVLHSIRAQALLLLGDAGVHPLRETFAELVAQPRVRDHLAGTITGLDVRYGDDPCGLVGSRMPDVDAETVDGAGTRTAVLLRHGRSVLLDASGDPERRRWLGEATAGWRGRLTLAFRRPGAEPDAQTALAGETALVAGEPALAGETETVLVRPDGYVAWGGARTADPRPALHGWVGAPAG